MTPPPASGGGSAGSGVTPDGFAPNTITRSAPFSGLGGAPFSNMGGGAYQLGLEPTVYLDELADYQSHLNEIRRINMGDDVADSAGYGLYLIRMPVSIQPGECTLKGHGAVLTATIRHDFSPDFLYTTFRNLVINDLVDQLTPILYEMIRSETMDQTNLPGIKTTDTARLKYQSLINNPTLVQDFIDQNYPANPELGQIIFKLTTVFMNEPQAAATSVTDTVRKRKEDIGNKSFQRWGSVYTPMSRQNDHSYPIAATEMDNVFIMQNLVMLALNCRDAMMSATPRADEVRWFLRREIESSYDVISQIYGADDPDSAAIVSVFEQQVESIAKHVRDHDYDGLDRDYLVLAGALPGTMRFITRGNDARAMSEDVHLALVNPMTILCYAIAVEAGLLDQQLRLDMKRVFKKAGVECEQVDAMHFYSCAAGARGRGEVSRVRQKALAIDHIRG